MVKKRKKKPDIGDHKKQKEDESTSANPVNSSNFSGESYQSSYTSESALSSADRSANLMPVVLEAPTFSQVNQGKSPTPPTYEPHPQPSASNSIPASSDLNQDVLNWYPGNHPGPFFVLIRSNDQLSARRMNSELFLFEKLKNIEYSEDILLKNIGERLYRASFKNADAANNFVLNKKLSFVGLEAFIPDRFTQKFGIIRNVPLSFTDKDIMTEIEDLNSLEVVSVHRFQRKNESGFNTISLPKTVRMFGTLVSVDIYVAPLRQCKNCGRLGHIALRCRGRKRCLNCGIHLTCPNNCADSKCDFCMSNLTCIENCGVRKCLSCNSTSHASEDHDKCPKWKIEKDIQSITIEPAQPAYNYPSYFTISEFEKTLKLLADQLSVIVNKDSPDTRNIIDNFKNSLLAVGNAINKK